MKIPEAAFALGFAFVGLILASGLIGLVLSVVVLVLKNQELTAERNELRNLLFTSLTPEGHLRLARYLFGRSNLPKTSGGKRQDQERLRDKLEAIEHLKQARTEKAGVSELLESLSEADQELVRQEIPIPFDRLRLVI